MKTKLLIADLYTKIGKVNFEIFQEQQNTDFGILILSLGCI